VLATLGTAKTRALQRATTTIPILTGVGDPVGSGFARSLAKPGGNITGFSFGLDERAQKMLELMREAVPDLAQVVILYGKSYGNEAEITAPFARAAQAAKIETQLRLVGNEEDVVRALRLAASSRRAAAIVYTIFEVDTRRIAELALRSGVPLVSHEDAHAEAGALLAYRLHFANMNERSAAIFERLLRGTPPSAIPFELPTLSRLVVNKRTAAALKLPLPPTLLLRADRVIE
jgi:putative ABC transport system substrate-binding protein